MGILDFFRTRKITKKESWKELGGYNSIFTAFGTDVYKSEIVKSCIRPLAEMTSKAHARCSDKKIEQILNYRPNIYMNGREFLYKVRVQLEVKNTVFIYIQRDDRGKVVGFYPVPYSQIVALEYQNGLFVEFHFDNPTVQDFVLPWEDLAVLRKDYYSSDITGDRNDAILNTLELLNTANQGVANAIKATANLRGILKSTKGMLAPEAVRQQKEDFVRDYLSLGNSGGIAALDATQEFVPIKMEPAIADYNQIKEFRENVYRYFGVNDEIVMGKLDSDGIEAVYEMKVEPFLADLSSELTSKVYAGKALSYENYIVFEANKLQFSSLSKKIQLYRNVVLYGGMTINEWREGSNLAPLPDGDKTIMRLDAERINEEGVSNGFEG